MDQGVERSKGNTSVLEKADQESRGQLPDSSKGQTRANEEDRAQRIGDQVSGRVVQNHSTHVEGLMPVLHKLAKVSCIQTITPGRIRNVKGQGTDLRIRITVPIRGGFKLNARHGHCVQEVFIITSLMREQLQQAIERILDQ